MTELACTARSLIAVAAILFSVALARADEKEEAAAEMEKAQEHLDRGEYDAAVARFNVARSLAPESSGPYLGLGLAHARAGRCVEALPYLEEYLRRKGEQAKPEGKTALADCRKQLPGRVILTSDPSGAEVRVDDPEGPLAGTTPWETISLPEGAHRLFLTLVGHKPASIDVTVAPATTSRPHVAFVLEKQEAPEVPREPVRPQPPAPPPVAQRGTLLVEVGPKEATISLNGVQVAERTRRYEGPLSAGSYALLVEREGWRSATTDAVIEPGGKAVKRVDLKPLRSSAWLGLAIPFTLIAAGSGIGALVSFYAADGAPEGPDFDRNKTLNAAMQGIFYPSLALAATGYLLYGVLNRGRVGDGPPVRVSAAPLRGGGTAGVSVRF